MTALICETEDLRRSLPARRSDAAVRGVVVTYPLGDAALHHGHMAATRHEIARRLSALMGYAYAGDYDALRHSGSTAYFVPSETLDLETALAAGVENEADLFGGVVPHPVVATKTITHPLVEVKSRAPAGWSVEFPRRVAGVVLDGLSAFTREDARIAGRTLMEKGPIRVKPGGGIAGLGQSVVDNLVDLDNALDALDGDALSRLGVVLEQNLEDVTTYSVGQVRVADFVATYYGTQSTTMNNRGAEVYGGSEITVVRGGFDAFAAWHMPEDIALAIDQARTYDSAAGECFKGMYASRRNYDIAQGRDSAGRSRSGVLEQSWRMGGASGAEVGALEAFRADPSLRIVRAMTCEVYGDAPALPPEAVIYFKGVDEQVGPLTKYALTQTYADAR